MDPVNTSEDYQKSQIAPVTDSSSKPSPSKLSGSFKSFFSLDYYLGILNGTRKFHLILATFLISLVASISTLFLVKDILPLTRDIEKTALRFVDEFYPEELKVSIKDGKASSNVTEPYHLTLPQEILEDPKVFISGKYSKASKTRILTIDTKGNIDDFESYQSMSLLTENSFVYYRDGGINVNSLREIEDITIDKARIKSEIVKYNKNFNLQTLIPGMVLALPLLAIIGIFIYQLIVYLFIAFLVWLMFRIRQIRYPFGRLYVYTAAIAFLPSLIWNLLVVIPAFTTLVISFSILPMIIILIVAYLGLQNLNHNDPKSVHREEKNQL